LPLEGRTRSPPAAIEPSFSLEVTVAAPALKTVKPRAADSGSADAEAGRARTISSDDASTRHRPVRRERPA